MPSCVIPSQRRKKCSVSWIRVQYEIVLPGLQGKRWSSAIFFYPRIGLLCHREVLCQTAEWRSARHTPHVKEGKEPSPRDLREQGLGFSPSRWTLTGSSACKYFPSAPTVHVRKATAGPVPFTTSEGTFPGRPLQSESLLGWMQLRTLLSSFLPSDLSRESPSFFPLRHNDGGLHAPISQTYLRAMQMVESPVSLRVALLSLRRSAACFLGLP